MAQKEIKINKLTVFRHLRDHMLAITGLGIRNWRELEEFLDDREMDGRRCPEVNPESPPPRPTRVVHQGKTVKVPKPTLVIDTREVPGGGAYSFDRYEKWFAEKRYAALPTGDYSLMEWLDEIAIERKSLPDLVGNIVTNRTRFLKQCERLAAYRRKALVIEATLAQVKSPYEESQVHPNAVVGTLFALQERWDIPVIYAGDREMAEETVAHMLSKFHILRWLEENDFPRHYVDGDI